MVVGDTVVAFGLLADETSVASKGSRSQTSSNCSERVAGSSCGRVRHRYVLKGCLFWILLFILIFPSASVLISKFEH